MAFPKANEIRGRLLEAGSVPGNHLIWRTLPILLRKIVKYQPESWQKLTATKGVFKGKLTKVYLDKYYRYSYICCTKPAGSLSFYQTTSTVTAKVQKLRTDGVKDGRRFRVCKMKQA